MNIINTKTRKVQPTHPGEMLREDFMPDYGLTTKRLAEGLGVSRQTVNELLRERRARAVDLWTAQSAYKNELKRIRPLHAA